MKELLAILRFSGKEKSFQMRLSTEKKSMNIGFMTSSLASNIHALFVSVSLSVSMFIMATRLVEDEKFVSVCIRIN